MARLKIESVRTFYFLFVLAFFLKFVGSQWDASYHFKYLFEKYSVPHIVNFSGFLLGAYLLFLEWKKPSHMDIISRNIATIGYLLFLVGIPLDFSYHIAYGIDLTTWSPTHFIYYIATAIMIFGAWRAYSIKNPDEFHVFRSYHTWFAMFFVECFLFPNLQQENGAISYDQFIHGKSIASAEIIKLISNPASQIFGGIPTYVYPIWSVLVVTLFSYGVFTIYKNKYLPFASLSLYILLRFIAKGIFFAVTYPTSYVPVTLLFIPIVFIFFRKLPHLIGIIGSFFYFFALYGIQQSSILITPPIELGFFVPTLISGIVSPYIIGYVLKIIRNRISSQS